MALLLLFASCSSNKNVYRSADFPEKASRHNTIAVLPFNIVQTGHKAKNISESDIRDPNEKLSMLSRNRCKLTC